VEHLPRRLRPGSGSVDPVAEHRVSQALQVQPDLMLAPGLERELEQRRRRSEALADDEVRHRVAGRLAGAGEAPAAGHVGIGNRRIDGAGVVLRRAVHQRQVLAIEAVRAEQFAPGLVRLARQGDGHAIRAVDGVSFWLERGRVLGIAGESGSGKSTLANLLVGLERPTGGLIRMGGRDLARLRGAELLAFRRQVQMVFQDPFASLNPRFTVRRTVEEPLVIHGVGDRASRLARAPICSRMRPTRICSLPSAP